MSSFMNKTLLPKAANISPNPSTSSSSSSTNGGISNTNNNNNDYRRPSQIESYGVHCQEPTCNLSDFLPFKCEFCKKSYCSSHRIPNSTHDCPSYDASKYDIKVDTCQWCNEPLKVEHLTNGRESDINIIMEDHINSGHCRVLQNVGKDGLLLQDNRSGQTISSSLSTANGNKKKKNNEKKCNYARCKNIMWVEMKCPQCRISFCPTHRETRSHKCDENMQVDTNNTTQGKNSKSSSKINTSPTTTPSAPSKMKNKLSSTGIATSSTTTKTSTRTSPLAPANPFSKLSLSSSSKNSSSSPPFTKVSTAALSKTSPTSTSSEYANSSYNNSNSSNNSNNNNKAVGAATPVTLPNVINVIKSKTTSNVSEMSTSRRAAKEREQAALALQNRARKG